jgi:cytochrome c5
MEALEIAHESATQLSAQTTPARDRYLPSPGILLRSAALIALGAYAAIAFVPGSRPAVPSTDDRDCLRQEAAAAIGRSPAEAERIMTTCAACHERDGRLLPRERQNGAIDSRTSWRHAEFQDEFEKLWSMALSEQGAEEAGRIALAGQVNDPADETRGLWQRREERDA